MTDTERDFWNEAEAQALRDLAPTPVGPSPHARARITSRLESLGLIRRRSYLVARLGAAAALVAAAFLAGRVSSGPSASKPQGPRYLLLLYGGVPSTPVEQDARRIEYGSWLRGLAAQGRAIDGAELVGVTHSLPDSSGGPLVGYFLITAPSEAEALALARSNPHIRHGGGVTVAAVR